MPTSPDEPLELIVTRKYVHRAVRTVRPRTYERVWHPACPSRPAHSYRTQGRLPGFYLDLCPACFPEERAWRKAEFERNAEGV